MLQLHTKEVDKSMAEFRQCQMTLLESRNKIMEMKAEVHGMLEEMRERMNCDMRSHETLRTYDRSIAGM